MVNNIPQHTQRLFWDIRKDNIDPKIHKKSIIERVLNYGTLKDMKWLASVYSKNEIMDVVTPQGKFHRSNVGKSAGKLASLIFK